MAEVQKEKISQQLKYLRDALDLSGTDFAEKIGINRNALYMVEGGQRALPETYILKIIELWPQVSYEWLKLGRGEAPIFNNGKDELETKYLKNLKKPDTKAIPVYDIDFSAGNLLTFNEDSGEMPVGYIDLAGFRKCVAFVRVKGNSMYKMFMAGDYIGLEPQESYDIIEYGNPFAIVTKAGERLVKIIKKGKDNDNLILHSENKDYDDIDIHKSNIEKLFKARGPIRDTFY